MVELSHMAGNNVAEGISGYDKARIFVSGLDLALLPGAIEALTHYIDTTEAYRIDANPENDHAASLAMAELERFCGLHEEVLHAHQYIFQLMS